MPLKFLIRTSDMSYPIIQGQYHDQNHLLPTPKSLLLHRYFHIQIGNQNHHSKEYYGCCNYEHTRIILIREMNFVHYCPDWDLYVVSNKSAACHSPVRVLQLILVPHTLHTNECRAFRHWNFIGTCRACVIRLDVEAYVLLYLNGGRHHQYPKQHAHPIAYSTFPLSDAYDIETTTSSTYHWHMDAYMDSMVDESYTSVSSTTCLSASSSSSTPSTMAPNVPSVDECKVNPMHDGKENQCSRMVSGGEKNVDDATLPVLSLQKKKPTRRKKKQHRR